MVVKFLGTRGEIEARSKRHRMHSSLLVVDSRNVMIDCGEDWMERIVRVHPDAILLTHAHPDHAGGLKRGSPCPVFASSDTWEILKRYPIAGKRVISPHEEFEIGQITFKAFPVEHSLRAPTVGYRVTGGGASFIYVPDVAAITERSHILRRVGMYIGDGATIVRPLLRKRDGVLIGHAPIATQLQWCEQEGIREAIFTHCGSQIVAGDESKASIQIRELGEKRRIHAQLAYDGLEIGLDAR